MFRGVEIQLPALAFIVAAIFGYLVGLSHFARATAGLFDSGLYLLSSQALHDCCVSLLANPSRWLVECQELKEHILLNGPVMPWLGCASFWLAGGRPSVLSMEPVLACMVLFHALTALGVFYVSRFLTGSNRCGILGGVLWALYPAALIGTTKFLTEPVTCALEVAAVLLACVAVKQAGDRAGMWLPCLLGLGALFSLCLLARPILAPGILAVALLPSIARNVPGVKLAVAGAASMLVGVALVLAPWLLYTKLAAGDFYLCPQRQPAYNLLCGFDLATDGRDCQLPPDVVESKGRDAVLTELTGQVARQPVEYGAMFLRKINRLFAVPWNDYRFPLLFLTPAAQNWWHAALMSVGCLGLIAFIANRGHAVLPSGRFLLSAQSTAGISCALLILAHLVYLPFSVTPRYAFTAMPFMCIFAAHCLFLLASLTRQSGINAKANIGPVLWRAAALLLSIVFVVSFDVQAALIAWGVDVRAAQILAACIKWLALLTGTAPLLALIQPASKRLRNICVAALSLLVLAVTAAEETGPFRELPTRLVPGQELIRTVKIAGARPDWCLLIVDSETDPQDCSIRVNGALLDGPAVPLYRFSHDGSAINKYQFFSQVLSVSVDRLRQWRALAVPVSILKLNAINEISIQPRQKSLTIFVSLPSPGDHLSVPSLFGFNYGKIASKQDDFDARIPCEAINGSQQRSFVRGNTYRIALPGLARALLVCGYPGVRSNSTEEKAVVSLDHMHSQQVYAAPTSDPPAAAAASETGEVTAVASAAQDLHVTSAPLTLSSRRPLRYLNSAMLRVGITGDCITHSGESRVLVELICRDLHNPSSLVCVFDTPQSVDLVRGQRREISFSGVIPTSALSGSDFAIEAVLRAEGGPARVRSISCTVQPIEAADFRQAQYTIF